MTTQVAVVLSLLVVGVVCAVLVVATAAAHPPRRPSPRSAAPHGRGRAALWSSLLHKVRGAPADRLVDILRAHGELDVARERLSHRSPVLRAPWRAPARSGPGGRRSCSPSPSSPRGARTSNASSPSGCPRTSAPRGRKPAGPDHDDRGPERPARVDDRRAVRHRRGRVRERSLGDPPHHRGHAPPYIDAERRIQGEMTTVDERLAAGAFAPGTPVPTELLDLRGRQRESLEGWWGQGACGPLAGRHRAGGGGARRGSVQPVPPDQRAGAARDRARADRAAATGAGERPRDDHVRVVASGTALLLALLVAIRTTHVLTEPIRSLRDTVRGQREGTGRPGPAPTGAPPRSATSPPTSTRSPRPTCGSSTIRRAGSRSSGLPRPTSRASRRTRPTCRTPSTPRPGRSARRSA